MTAIRPRNRRVAKLAVVLLAAALFGAPAAAAVAARTSDSPSIRPPAADAVPDSNGTAAAPQTVETAQQIIDPAEAVSGDGHAADGGPGHGGDGLDGGPGLGDGLGDPVLEAPPLGEAADPLSAADLLGPNGVYTLNDGDREIRLRLLDPADAAATAALAGAALHTDGAESSLEELAASAATAYAPSENATGASQQARPSNWLVSDAESLQLADALSSVPGVDFAAPNLFTPLSAETSSQ